MNANTQRGNWLLTLPLAGIAVLYILVFFLPSQRAMEALNEQLVAKQEVLAQADALLPTIAAVEAQLKEASGYNSRWIEVAPSERDLSGLYGRLHELVKKAGVATTRFDPQPPEELQRMRSVTIAMGLTGSFRQVSRFLEDLEALPQTIWIENLQLEGPGKRGKDIQCELNLEVFVDKSDLSGQAKGS